MFFYEGYWWNIGSVLSHTNFWSLVRKQCTRDGFFSAPIHNCNELFSSLGIYALHCLRAFAAELCTVARCYLLQLSVVLMLWLCRHVCICIYTCACIIRIIRVPCVWMGFNLQFYCCFYHHVCSSSDHFIYSVCQCQCEAICVNFVVCCLLCKEISYCYLYKAVFLGGCPVKAEKAGPRKIQHSSVVQGFFRQGTFLPGVWAVGQESFWLHAAKILPSSICERDQTDCPAGRCLHFPLCFSNK